MQNVSDDHVLSSLFQLMQSRIGNRRNAAAMERSDSRDRARGRAGERSRREPRAEARSAADYDDPYQPFPDFVEFGMPSFVRPVDSDLSPGWEVLDRPPRFLFRDSSSRDELQLTRRQPARSELVPTLRSTHRPDSPSRPGSSMRRAPSPPAPLPRAGNDSNGAGPSHRSFFIEEVLPWMQRAEFWYRDDSAADTPLLGGRRAGASWRLDHHASETSGDSPRAAEHVVARHFGLTESQEVSPGGGRAEGHQGGQRLVLREQVSQGLERFGSGEDTLLDRYRAIRPGRSLAAAGAGNAHPEGGRAQHAIRPRLHHAMMDFVEHARLRHHRPLRRSRSRSASPGAPRAAVRPRENIGAGEDADDDGRPLRRVRIARRRSSEPLQPLSSAARGYAAPGPGQLMPRVQGVCACAFLQEGVRFEGAQSFAKTGRARRSHVDEWRVQVEITRVRWDAGLVCGTMTALDIPSQDAPISTYWEGEVIDNDRVTFSSARFGTRAATDLEHWSSFAGFSNVRSASLELGSRGAFTCADLDRTGYVFMRWKELEFMSSAKPQRALTIAGFYYICLNRSTGSIEGLYHDPCTSPHQKLYLRPCLAQAGCSFGDVTYS